MSDEIKFKILAFLINNVIEEENLMEIPNEYLLHFIILIHLLENNSLRMFEALAFTKALKDVYQNKISRTTILPEKVNVRAFRASYLYSNMYYTLVRCLSSIGLNRFVHRISMDNIQYQIYYQEMMDQEIDENNQFEQLMRTIQE
jgi:hypothetical protein